MLRHLIEMIKSPFHFRFAWYSFPTVIAEAEHKLLKTNVLLKTILLEFALLVGNFSNPTKNCYGFVSRLNNWHTWELEVPWDQRGISSGLKRDSSSAVLIKVVKGCKLRCMNQNHTHATFDQAYFQSKVLWRVSRMSTCRVHQVEISRLFLGVRSLVRLKEDHL